MKKYVYLIAFIIFSSGNLLSSLHAFQYSFKARRLLNQPENIELRYALVAVQYYTECTHLWSDEAYNVYLSIDSMLRSATPDPLLGNVIFDPYFGISFSLAIIQFVLYETLHVSKQLYNDPLLSFLVKEKYIEEINEILKIQNEEIVHIPEMVVTAKNVLANLQTLKNRRLIRFK